MKTTMNQFFKIFLLICVVGLTSCSSNDDDVKDDGAKEVTKEFQAKISKMSLPSSLSTSTNARAKEVTSYFSTVKNLGQSFSQLLTVPPGATSSYISNDGLAGKGNSAKSSKTYTWSANGMTITYVISEESDRYTFEYSIEGGSFSGKVMDGYQLKDGSYADFKMYSGSKVVSTFKFWIDGDVVTSEIASKGLNLKMKVNLADNSGNIKVYQNTNLTAEYNWNSDGTGWYKNYTTNQTTNW